MWKDFSLHASTIFMLLLYILFASYAVWLCTILVPHALEEIQHRRLILQSAEVAQGTIIDRYISDGRYPKPWIEVSYTHPSSTTELITMELIRRKQYRTVRINDPIELMVATEAPQAVVLAQNYPPNYIRPIFEIVLILFPSGALVISVLREIVDEWGDLF